MGTRINFSGDQHVVVQGDPDLVGQTFRNQRGGPAPLETKRGDLIFVNWSNVLYLEEVSDSPAAVRSLPH